jgi:hypothetical protein
MGKNQDPDTGKTFRIIFPRAKKQFFGLKILKYFDADTKPGFGIFLTLDPGSGMEKFRSGIQDKHLGSAILIILTII